MRRHRKKKYFESCEDMLTQYSHPCIAAINYDYFFTNYRFFTISNGN